eukprot:4798975-Pleurochrysis_carterae.AAC.1
MEVASRCVRPAAPQPAHRKGEIESKASWSSCSVKVISRLNPKLTVTCVDKERVDDWDAGKIGTVVVVVVMVVV